MPRRDVVKNNLTALLIAVIVTLFIACGSDEALGVNVPMGPTTTAIPLPGSSVREQSRNEVANEAIRFATAGCPSIDEKLSGPPTRVLAALTSSRRAGHLVNPENNLHNLQGEVGPGASGITVWVVAVEGTSIPTFGEDPWDGANVRSFVFVINAFLPELTGCVVRDAPMPTKYTELFSGGFRFEVLFDGQ